MAITANQSEKEWLSDILAALGGSAGGGAALQKVQGTAADGTAVVGNPVLVGLTDNTNTVSLRSVSAVDNVATATSGPRILGVSPLLQGPSAYVALATVQSIAGTEPYSGARMAPAAIYAFNGSNNVEKCRVANTAAGTTGTGLLGAGLLGFDGTNYQLLRVESASNLNLRCGIFNGATQAAVFTAADGASLISCLRTAAYSMVYNGATEDLQRNGLGTHANAWNNAATGAGGTSGVLDAHHCPHASFFGNTSGATTFTIQASQDNTNFYDTGTTTAPAGSGNFGISFDTGARYIRVKSSNNVTVTGTLAAKG